MQKLFSISTGIMALAMSAAMASAQTPAPAAAPKTEKGDARKAATVINKTIKNTISPADQAALQAAVKGNDYNAYVALATKLGLKPISQAEFMKNKKPTNKPQANSMDKKEAGHGKMNGRMSNDKIRAAITAHDYAAFKIAAVGTPFEKQNITQEQFNQMVAREKKNQTQRKGNQAMMAAFRAGDYTAYVAAFNANTNKRPDEKLLTKDEFNARIAKMKTNAGKGGWMGGRGDAKKPQGN